MTENGKQILLSLMWPSLILLMMILLSSISLVGLAFFTPAGEVGKIVGEAHGLMRLATILLTIPALVVLALTERIDGPVAAAAVSGIAGYVLGQTP